MTPEDCYLGWRAGATGHAYRHDFEAVDGRWELATRADTRITGIVVVSALDVEVVGESPQPDHVTVTWRGPTGGKRIIIDQVRPGVWTRTEQFQRDEGWHDCGVEEIVGLRVDRTEATDESLASV